VYYHYNTSDCLVSNHDFATIAFSTACYQGLTRTLNTRVLWPNAASVHATIGSEYAAIVIGEYAKFDSSAPRGCTLLIAAYIQVLRLWPKDFSSRYVHDSCCALCRCLCLRTSHERRTAAAATSAVCACSPHLSAYDMLLSTHFVAALACTVFVSKGGACCSASSANEVYNCTAVHY
jgi:hypothetical protein